MVLFIEQVLGADHSCQDAVARGLSARVALGQAPCSLNTGPYCRARLRLALGLIERLGREVATRLMAAQPAPWLWRGRNVKLVDGTTVSMPDTQKNQEAFPQSRGQKPGLGFPLARLVGIVSLSCGAVLEWASGPCEGKNTGETALLWALMDKLARATWSLPIATLPATSASHVCSNRGSTCSFASISAGTRIFAADADWASATMS